MWLNKMLDVEEDWEKLRKILENNMLKNIKKKRLTPLEFTILEAIFNIETVSGYDLINFLNEQFAKTWEASSGTIYPILSKLEKNGYLSSRQVKSPLGPLKKVYSLTDTGRQIIKLKVNDNFLEQLKYVENFLFELSLIYIKSFPNEEQARKTEFVIDQLNRLLKNIEKKVPKNMKFPRFCPECGSKINIKTTEKGGEFCTYCGEDLRRKI